MLPAKPVEEYPTTRVDSLKFVPDMTSNNEVVSVERAAKIERELELVRATLKDFLYVMFPLKRDDFHTPFDVAEDVLRKTDATAPGYFDVPLTAMDEKPEVPGLHLRLIMDVYYQLNGESAESMKTLLSDIARSACAQGMVTGETDAVVENWKLSVHVVKEDDTGQSLLQQRDDYRKWWQDTVKSRDNWLTVLQQRTKERDEAMKELDKLRAELRNLTSSKEVATETSPHRNADTDILNWLTREVGHFQDGSTASIKISGDDATRTWCASVGKNITGYGDTVRLALLDAMNNPRCGNHYDDGSKIFPNRDCCKKDE
jgi:hypothetical protein